MLIDRQYMRKHPDNFRDDRGREGLYWLYGIIFVNIFLFLIGHTPGSQFEEIFALNVSRFLHGRVWQPLTAMFLHANFTHLFFNMYSLYLFGGFVAPAIGARKFLRMYLIAGLVGNVLWMLCAADSGYAVLLGASGAIMGVIAVSAMLAPNIPMMLLFIPFPIKLKTLAIVFFSMDVILEFMNTGASVAYLAHIGGFIAGIVYGATVLRRDVSWNPLAKIVRRFSGIGRKDYSNYKYNNPDSDVSNGWEYKSPDNDTHFSAKGDFYKDLDRPVTQKELDNLLDKLSKVGINGMNEYELRRLHKAREQMRNQ